ncbi:hypothetical protein, partial [Aeromonas salmonicida]|uniref:hypothetical protein n=1 Tax=Aeromonas salmonicida TaxID=645 RepID=UPI00223F6FDB
SSTLPFYVSGGQAAKCDCIFLQTTSTIKTTSCLILAYFYKPARITTKETPCRTVTPTSPPN